MKKLIFTLAALLILPIVLTFCKEECKHEEIESTVVAPTCDSEGYTQNSCKKCSFTYKTDIVAPTGHTFSKKTVEPTCTEEGYTVYTCDCGFTYKSDFVKPLGHTLEKKVTPPTCTDEGYTTYTCKCGYSYKGDYVKPLGHKEVMSVHAPSCTEQGYTEVTCSVCGEKRLTNYIAPKGHNFKKEVTPVTSFQKGFTKYTCDCGYSYTADYVMSSDIFTGAYTDAPNEIGKGIDISNWNGKINWQEIKDAGITYVIIKAGSSKGPDPTFEQNYKDAKNAGLDVGCYFYSYAMNTGESFADAKKFLDIIKGKKFEYPVYLDMEEKAQESLEKGVLTDICRVFIEELQKNKYFCGLYTNYNWLTNLLKTEFVTTYFDVWLARWRPSGSSEWNESYGKPTGMWQYTSEGKIGSHKCDFDMNICYKDYPKLIKLWEFNGY